jgi:hypothetical protein
VHTRFSCERVCDDVDVGDDDGLGFLAKHN